MNAACAACDYAVLGQTVPDLIGELYTLAEVHGSTEARRLLADVMHAAFYLSKDLGHGDLAWMVSGHLHATAVAIGEPVWAAVASFVRSHATVGSKARERGLTLAERSAELLEPDEGPAGQVYGMLHLSAALQSAVTGRAEGARAHLAEASETTVTRRGQPIAVLSAIDAEEFYDYVDYVLAHAPEFVRGRKEADDAIARGELGIPLADVLAELDAEDRGDRRSA